MNQTILVIPSHQLGLLEPMFKEFAMLETKSKRERQAKWNRIAEVLKALRLVEKKALIKGLSYGCDNVGTLSAFVIFEKSEQLVGQAGPISEPRALIGPEAELARIFDKKRES